MPQERPTSSSQYYQSDLEKAIAAKSRLEFEIRQLIKCYEEKHGVKVGDIQYERRTSGWGELLKHEVKVTVTL